MTQKGCIEYSPNEEFEEIKKHIIIGYELIHTYIIYGFVHSGRGIRSLHEKWNGNGYPDGLIGADSPLFGRILTIVEVS